LSLSRARLADDMQLPPATIDHLLGRYGSALTEIRDLIAADPDLAHPLGNTGYLRADIVYAVTHEGALHLDDILTRRTHLSIETPDRGTAVAAEAAALAAPHMGWDHADIAREIERYTARVAAELDAQHQPDDATADAIRRTAPDSRSTPATPVGA
ncbi:glycerol-3-phosphate dehydrogenase C-terminal domain-containing protein, partial [Nocardia cyriacigeorgica]